VDDVALDEISVMDKVISSDRVRAKAMDDFEGGHLFLSHSPHGLKTPCIALNEALESQSVITVQAAVAMIEFERAQEDLEEKRKLASRRSGTRHVFQLIRSISYNMYPGERKRERES